MPTTIAETETASTPNIHNNSTLILDSSSAVSATSSLGSSGGNEKFLPRVEESQTPKLVATAGRDTSYNLLDSPSQVILKRKKLEFTNFNLEPTASPLPECPEENETINDMREIGEGEENRESDTDNTSRPSEQPALQIPKPNEQNEDGGNSHNRGRVYGRVIRRSKNTSLYLGGLSAVVKKEHIEELFGKFGKCENVWLADPPGFGFVTFISKDEALKAVDELNGTEFMECKLRVEVSRSKERGFRGGVGREMSEIGVRRVGGGIGLYSHLGSSNGGQNLRATSRPASASSSGTNLYPEADIFGRFSGSQSMTHATLLNPPNDGLLGRFPGDEFRNYNLYHSLQIKPTVDDFNSMVNRVKHSMDRGTGARVTEEGVISIELTGGTRVDISANKGIRLINVAARIIVSLSANGGSSALIHPAGRVYQYGSRVEASTNFAEDNIVSKMWYKGITFSTENGALVYLLDDGGSRTVHDVFSDLAGDFTTPVFLDKADIGRRFIPECTRQLQHSRPWTDELGLTENWDINGIRIIRTPDDVTRVLRGPNKYQLRICGNGLASISTPFIHCTASCGKVGPESCHLFVRRGERRLHFDGSLFILRNGGHSAGFDKDREFRVF